jgi:RNA-directed DNA polymerase
MSKRPVWEASTRGKAKQGAAGVEGPARAAVEEEWEDTLDQGWTRLASGSDVPPPVRRVESPTGEGSGTRPLGLPTGAARGAQAVVKASLEPARERPCPPDADG